MKCFVCGKSIPQQYKETRFGYVVIGRPKLYCSDTCRDFQKYFIACQKQLEQIVLDDEHKRKIRGEMFRVANTLKFPTIVNFSTKKASAERI